MTAPNKPLLFALNATHSLGAHIAAHMQLSLSPHEERVFEDGEHKARPLVSVRGREAYVIHSLHGDETDTVNDKLCRLLFFVGALKDSGAARVTVVVPYLAYARKDRRTTPQDPVTTRYLAMLLEAVGVDTVMALDIHNVVAFQNAFRCQTIHLDSRRVFIDHILARIGDAPVTVVSPDPGGVKRAQLFLELFEQKLGRPVDKAFMEKRRTGGVVSGNLLVGEVKDSIVLVVDDLISSGGTMLRAAEACLAHGARQVFALAAHGLFVGNAATVIADPRLAKTMITDSVPPFRLTPEIVENHLEIVSVAPLFAEAIQRHFEGGSISELLGGTS